MHRVTPESGQESVWDYPRPPSMQADERQVVVWFNGEVIADSTDAIRVLETSHPPVFYIPGSDTNMDYLFPTLATSWCEYKGRATYWTVAVGELQAIDAAWSYPNPVGAYRELAGRFAFYPSRMERCTVGGVDVVSQAGDFYGGWITPEIVGPFKGGPGTTGW